MSRKDNDTYRPRHLVGKRGSRSTKSAERSRTRSQYTADSREERASFENFEAAYDYQPIRRSRSKYATEVGLINREPDSWNNSGHDTPVRDTEDLISARHDEYDTALVQTEAEPADAAPVSVEGPDLSETVEAQAVDDDDADAAPAGAETPDLSEAAEAQAVDDADDADAAPAGAETPDLSEAAEVHAVDDADDAEIAAKSFLSFDAPEDDKQDSDEDDDEYGQDEKKPKKKPVKKVLLAILSVFLVLIIAMTGIYFVLNEMGRRSIHNNEGMEITAPTQDESGNEIVSADKYGRIITYNGVSYTYNDDIIALTLIGIDNGTGEEKNMQMADAIYILAINSKTGETKILGVPRDVMTDVDVYSEDGTFVDARKLQIAYSYAYHSDKKTSGDNTNKSVSRLFFGLPAKNYFAIDLDALISLNDAIGGVTLTSSLTFDSPEDGHTIYEGDTVTLHGKEAEVYIRRRDITELESNNDRMQRQQEYMKAFTGSIFQAARKDMSIISTLYNTISSHSDSTLDLPELTYIASIALTKLDSAQEIEYINLKGKIVSNKHAEMYVTDEEVLRTMLDVFYKPMTMNPDTKTSAATIDEK